MVVQLNLSSFFLSLGEYSGRRNLTTSVNNTIFCVQLLHLGSVRSTHFYLRCHRLCVANALPFPLRYLIPNAGDATKVIKQQIMKVLDALESS